MVNQPSEFVRNSPLKRWYVSFACGLGCLATISSLCNLGQVQGETGQPAKAASHTRQQEGSSTHEPEASATKESAQKSGLNRALSAAARTATITTPNAKEWIEGVVRDMSPANDGWESELFAERADKQLKHLGELMLHEDGDAAAELASMLTDSFSCTPLRPAAQVEAYSDSSVTVSRPEGLPQAGKLQGVGGLGSALKELTTGLDDATGKYFKFKLFRVTPDDEQIETTCYFEISGRTATGAIQRSATWVVRWEPGTGNQDPRFESIVVTDYEEVFVRNRNRTLFSEVTAEVFRDEPAYQQQFLPGIDYWRSRLENYLGIYFDGLHGLAVADVNSDGLDDVYLCEPGGLPNRLFVQRPDGLGGGYLSDIRDRSTRFHSKCDICGLRQ